MQIRAYCRTCTRVLALLAIARTTSAVGWDNNDFIITGGASFPTKVGVFDENLVFKGYLDTNYNGATMRFDAAGNLVVTQQFAYGTRVYDHNGNIVGGFSQNQPSGFAGGIEIAPDGSYLLATTGLNAGIRQVAPDGTFIRQFGTGDFTSVANIPGNKIWAGSTNRNFVNVFDLTTGLQTGTIAFNPAGLRGLALRYRASTNTMLNSGEGGGISEVDLTGNFLRSYQTLLDNLHDFTLGPNDDIYITTHFNFSGAVAQVSNSSGRLVALVPTNTSIGEATGIIWTGLAPEPNSLMIVAGGIASLRRRTR